MARRKLSSEMNVVPYIDVMLVLLVIFMVTAPLMTQGIEVDLPDVNAASLTSQDEDRVLSVDAQGGLHANFGGEHDAPLSPDEVRSRVRDLLAQKPDQMIQVEGDGKVPYQHVAEAMALLSEVGVKRIGFRTEEAPAGSSAQNEQPR